MLGCAFFGFLLLARCGVVSGYVPVVIALLWVGKICLVIWLEANCGQQEAEAIELGMGTELMHLHIQSYFEVYTPLSLAEGVRFKVIIQGTDSYLHRGDSYAMLDAVYLMGGGQYARHQGLLLDGQPGVPYKEDPSAHSYAYLYTGTGRQLSILLPIPQGHRTGHGGPIAEGPLQVSIRTLSAAEDMQIKTIEDDRLREAEAMQRQELSRQAVELATLAYIENNFLQPEYQKNYAAKHTHEILTTFHRQWRDEYLTLISNELLYALVQEEHPHVLAFFEARFEVVRIAQRLAVEPTPPPDPEQKPKVTPEEWVARIERYRQRSLTRKRVKVEDYKADVMQDLALLQEFIADLDHYPLDEDERERLITEFKERLLSGEEEHSHSFKQL
jgi:hypothetical protein